MPEEYDAILFDVDGVLLDRHADRPAVYESAVGEAFASFGVPASAVDLSTFVVGARVDEMRSICSVHGLDLETFWPEREAAVSQRQRKMMDRGERVPYGDCAVLDRLADVQTLGIVSSNQHTTVQYLLDRFDLGGLFDVAYGRGPTITDFKQTKPDTHYIDRALADLGVDGGLYVGDSACDVVAAHDAGLDSVFIRRPHRSDYDLPEPPTYETESLAALPNLPGIPA